MTASLPRNTRLRRTGNLKRTRLPGRARRIGRQPKRLTPAERSVRDRAWHRADGRCEAHPAGYGRCPRAADHPHHRLPVSRGGDLLDWTGDAANIAWLCADHHRVAHQQTPGDGDSVWIDLDGRQPLLVDGEAFTRPDQTVGYRGRDRAYHARHGGPS